MIITTTGCHSRQEPKVDITPHHINLQADSFYQQAMTLMESSYDVDSTRKCIRFLDKALAIDSLNPDYYGIKPSFYLKWENWTPPCMYKRSR